MVHAQQCLGILKVSKLMPRTPKYEGSLSSNIKAAIYTNIQNFEVIYFGVILFLN